DPADREAVSAPVIRRRFIEMLSDSLRQGVRGALHDLQLGARHWSIPALPRALPVLLWHGEEDADSPVSIARYLSRALPNARLRTFRDEGHVSVLVHHAGEIAAELRAAAWPPPCSAESA